MLQLAKAAPTVATTGEIMASKPTTTTTGGGGGRVQCHCCTSNAFRSNAVAMNGDECPASATNIAANADVAKIAHKLHQLEIGQKKIIQLLNHLDKELSARVGCCSAAVVAQQHPSSTAAGSFKTENLMKK